MRLRKYHISLWPNNQPPIYKGCIKAKNIKNARKNAKQIFKGNKDALEILNFTAEDITFPF